jgi:anti-sigma-K factor RskA
MNCTECTARLQDYVDGHLSAPHIRAIQTHLGSCAHCRSELESLRALVAQVRTLPREIEPQRDLWRGINAQLARDEHASSPDQRLTPITGESGFWSTFLPWFAPLAVAASVVFVSTLAERKSGRPTMKPWSVAAIAGAPRVDALAVRQQAQFRLGQWLETDAESRAKVTVGSIGEVEVEPNSRLKLVGIAADDHRLQLSRGTMSALIWAPPRLFFVDTPSATAVDLGCAYTLSVDGEGNGELHVSAGYVALEDGDRESIIRYGMKCLTRRGSGPGTPFAVDAPEPLRAALSRFDFEPGAATATLPDVLAHARAEDAVTLWHLLTRTEGAQRAEVYDLLAKHAPPPAGVTRAGILGGDAKMRQLWGNELGLLRF